jgi:hypothetical protein
MNAELSSLMEFIRSCTTIVDPTVNAEYTLCTIDGYPIVPFIHHDVEITLFGAKDAVVNDNDWHVHFDYRFFDNAMIRRWKDERAIGDIKVYQRRHGMVFFLVNVIKRNAAVVLKQLPCRRPSLGVPLDSICTTVRNRLESTMPELNDSAANLKKLQCSRCPHKGFHFDQSNVKGGLLHCPMHGQKFKLNDGRWIKPNHTFKHLVTNYEQ